MKNVVFSNTESFHVSFGGSENFNTFLGKEVLHDSTVEPIEYYKGETVVEPKAEEQVLPTAKKTLRDDIVINKVKTYEVSNDAGGVTFSIL